MIDPAITGTTLPATTLDVERGPIRLFAKAIGEDNPIYFDAAAARKAGYPDIVVPPTFLTSHASGGDDLMRALVGAGADLRRLLHGEQKFRYHRMTFAGQTLQLSPRIGEVYQKKSGALEFVVVRTTVTDDDGAVADLQSLLVFTNPQEGK
ncbi:MaoC family dehydratase N-terminal domain-containing protein [Mycobacterium sp. NPDC003449]